MKDRTILIGIDWGASTFRAWAFDEEGDVIGGISVPDGILTHSGDAMGRLKFHINEWLSEYEQGQPPADGEGQTFRAGLGVYYLEGPCPENGEKKHS